MHRKDIAWFNKSSVEVVCLEQCLLQLRVQEWCGRIVFLWPKMFKFYYDKKNSVTVGEFCTTGKHKGTPHLLVNIGEYAGAHKPDIVLRRWWRPQNCKNCLISIINFSLFIFIYQSIWNSNTFINLHLLCVAWKGREPQLDRMWSVHGCTV